MDNERTSGSAPVPQEDAGRVGGQSELFRETIRLEDRRLDEHRRRAELAKQALELSDEQDKRQAKRAARELESREGADIRHHRLMARQLYVSEGARSRTGSLSRLFRNVETSVNGARYPGLPRNRDWRRGRDLHVSFSGPLDGRR